MPPNPPLQEPGAIPTGLPDATFLLDLEGYDPGTAGKKKAIYEIAVKEALEMVRAATSLALPQVAFTGERVPLRDYYDVNLTRWWPVVSLQSVRLAGQQLTIGSEEDVYNGKATVAVDSRGEGVRVCDWVMASGGGNAALFVDYTAGMNAVPTDLLEVVRELAMLIYNEKDRIGKASDKLGEAQITFSRELPAHLQMAVRRYKRTQVYV